MPTEVYKIQNKNALYHISYISRLLNGLALGFRTGRVSDNLSFDL
jgi:hypothetical protein